MSVVSVTTRGLCGHACPIAQQYNRLIQDGAVLQPSNTLFEPACRITLVPARFARCMVALQLDAENARYRWPPGAINQSKMCDFLAIDYVDGRTGYCLLELKSGEPYLDEAAQQLAEGLRVVLRHVQPPAHPNDVRAVLVAGHISLRLLQLARTPSGRLRSGNSVIQIELVTCQSNLML